ncbi:hypothetical protein BG015_002572 [Linnemannia schmuckeri]|uniref:PAP-associated domain-containing protein n=1 Tax=Linnemannia schmuckeri TaxID=64567 RepID=A0A9P5S2Y5_9FUNG|nr:hypothetical protein BG015_002572 [Linnemannia schmuckeri]
MVPSRPSRTSPDPTGSSRSSKHIFRMSRPHFIEYLFNLILFECSSQVASGRIRRFTKAHLAGCFRRVREMYEQDRNDLLDDFVDYDSWNEHHQDGGCSYVDDFVVWRVSRAPRPKNSSMTTRKKSLRCSRTTMPILSCGSPKPRHHRKSEMQAIRQVVDMRIREHFRDYSIEVHLFGSFASGFCSMSSDAEMTCDVNLKQPMGVHNSKLISTYFNIDDRFKTLWFSIKQIGKQYDIISASAGFLSSYTLTMMLIIFLEDVTSPSILPRLQQSPMVTIHTIDGHDCSFDSKTIYTSYDTDNRHSSGQLLIDFFYFYGYVFNCATQGVHPSLGKIQDCNITPSARSRTDSRPKEWLICISDFFITDRNVAGNCSKENVAKIQACFQSAYLALEENDINKTFNV